MKNRIYTIALILGCVSLQAQVAIGKDKISNTSVSLEFGTGAKGIIMPYITDTNQLSDAVPGTVILDKASGRLQYKSEASAWQYLSPTGKGFVNGEEVSVDGVVDASIQSGKTDLPNARVVIGPPTDTAPGILVLSDTNKAMVLPKVDSPHLNIIDPAPGMMVYDTKEKQLAVFNGTVWTFWKP